MFGLKPLEFSDADVWDRNALFQKLATDLGLTYEQPNIPNDTIIEPNQGFPYRTLKGQINGKDIEIVDLAYAKIHSPMKYGEVNALNMFDNNPLIAEGNISFSTQVSVNGETRMLNEGIKPPTPPLVTWAAPWKAATYDEIKQALNAV